MAETLDSKDIVQTLNESLRELLMETSFSKTTQTLCFTIENFRPGISRRIEELLNESTRTESLRGIKELNFVDNDNICSAFINFENHLDAKIYFKVLAKSKDFFVSGKEMLVKRNDQRENEFTSSQYKQIPTPIHNKNNLTRSFYGNQNEIKPSHTYDAIFIENIAQFLEPSVTLATLQRIISVFTLFNDIEKVFLPISKNTKYGIELQQVGFIGFSHNEIVQENVLCCLYHLNNLTLEQLLRFSKEDIHINWLDQCAENKMVSNSHKGCRLKLTLCQEKHTSHLLANTSVSFVAISETPPKVEIFQAFPNLEDYNHNIFTRFSRHLNYQETNVYVNNLPILFKNNDEAWQRFWNQFGLGGIKSAKIIKPQFYFQNSDPSYGKFGFVFYTDMYMAIRAILATNKKIIKLKDLPSFQIETSFAIQRKSHTSMKRFSTQEGKPIFQEFYPGYPMVFPNQYWFNLPCNFPGGSFGFLPEIMFPHPLVNGPFTDDSFMALKYVPFSGKTLTKEVSKQDSLESLSPTHIKNYSDSLIIHGRVYPQYGLYSRDPL